MPITPKNLTKNIITPNSKNKGGYAFWGDDIVTWGDSSYYWSSPIASIVNLVKNIISPSNKTKN